MQDDLQGSQIITPNDRYRVLPKLEPKVDLVISKIIGKTIYTTDPRVLSYIVKWKKGKPQDSMVSDNFLRNPEFIRGLKETLNINL